MWIHHVMTECCQSQNCHIMLLTSFVSFASFSFPFFLWASSTHLKPVQEKVTANDHKYQMDSQCLTNIYQTDSE